MSKKSNAQLDPEKDDYQAIVANMESVVQGIPDSDWISPEDKLRLMHAKEGIVTEAGELADQFKRHIFYRQPLDRLNVIEELGDVLFVLVFGPTLTILKTLVQGLGDYLQHFFEMSLRTDAESSITSTFCSMGTYRVVFANTSALVLTAPTAKRRSIA